MSTLSLARRYARALLDVSAEKQNADAALEQLGILANVFAASDELRDLSGNPAYSKEQRIGVVEALFKALSLTDLAVQNLGKLLAERGRLDDLGNIHRVFRDLVDARAGRVRGKVTGARPLPPDLVEKLGQQLQRMTQRDVVLESRVDPSLLGGLSTQLGNVVFDGSIKSNLEELRLKLSR